MTAHALCGSPDTRFVVPAYGIDVFVRQLAFFESGRRTLVDDPTGWIYYIANSVDAATATAWFADLQTSIAWQHERRPMYDRVVDVPRLTAHFAPGERLPPVLSAAKRVVEDLSHVRYNSVGLNFYRDGRDSVAMHNDRLNEMLPGSPVALVSLGSPRTMRIHSKSRPRKVFNIELEPGSLFVMAGASQEHWEHGIPKTKDAVGPRISLAFRQR